MHPSAALQDAISERRFVAFSRGGVTIVPIAVRDDLALHLLSNYNRNRRAINRHVERGPQL